jgi:hypothetical protein
MESLAELLMWTPLLIALCGPIAVVGNSHLGRAALVAFGPAALSSLAAVVSMETAWGHRPSGDSGFSNTANLVFGAIVLGIAGTIGFAIAASCWASARRRARRTPAQRRAIG